MIKDKKRLWLYLLAIILLLFAVFRYTAPLRMVGNYRPENRTYVQIASKDNILFVLQPEHIGYAYNELLLFDISVPNKPSLISKLEFAKDMGDTDGITVNEDYLYIVTGGKQGILVIDISNLESPELAANFAPPADRIFNSPLLIDNNTGYVATLPIKGYTRIPALSIFSLDNPREMKQLSLTPGFREPLWLTGNYLYIEKADLRNPSACCLGILDVSDPKDPIVIKEVRDSEYLSDVYADRNTLYIASQEKFLVADISNPANPSIEQFPLSGGDQLIVDEKTAFFV